ncbi:MAG: hypothetical protein WCW17_04045 [Patescibacteria group bacterium]|jgi:hypothetical protein
MDDVIYLDTDEEITSAIDKMQQCMAKRISLVVPREASILQSVVNLKLIKKEAESLGKEIAIVTSDKTAHNLAGQVGLDIYESLKDSRPVSNFKRSQPMANEVIELDFSEKQKMPSGIKVHHFQDEGGIDKNNKKKEPASESIKEEKEAFEEEAPDSELKTTESETIEEEYLSPSKSNYSSRGSDHIFIPKKFLFAIPIVLVLILLAIILTIPKATITLSVKGEAFTKDVDMMVDKDIKEPSIDTNTIPGTLISREISGSKTFKATGEKSEGEKATGKVTLKNYWDSTAKSYAKGTKLVYSGGLVFILTQDVTVPGGTTSLVQGEVRTQPGMIDATVESEKPGEEYNVAAGRFSISGLSSIMSAKIFAESTEKFTGGLTKKILILSQDDVDKAISDYTAELKPNLIDDIGKNANNNKIISEVIQVSVVESKTNKNVGDETDEFNLELKIKGEVIGFNEEQFMSTLVQSTQKTIDASKKLLVDQTKTIVDGATVENGKLKVSTKIDGRIVTNFSEDELKRKISMKRIGTAKSTLLENKDITQVDIWISPPWTLSFLPLWQKKINFEFKYDQQ